MRGLFSPGFWVGVALRAAAAWASLTGGAGCYAGNLYTTGRALRAGVSEATIAPEYAVASVGQGVAPPGAPRRLRDATGTAVVLPPVVGGRVGVTDQDDFAFSFHQGTFHGEWKHQLLDQRQGEGVDLALVPGLDGGVLYGAVSLPVVVSRRVGGKVDVVVSTGMMLSQALYDGTYVAPRGGLVRAGLGLRFWITPTFALQPEGTWLQGVGGDAARVLNVGLGFAFLPVVP